LISLPSSACIPGSGIRALTEKCFRSGEGAKWKELESAPCRGKGTNAGNGSSKGGGKGKFKSAETDAPRQVYIDSSPPRRSRWVRCS
jgi:hypothetical protein